MASPSKHGSTLVSDPNAIGDAHEIAVESILIVAISSSISKVLVQSKRLVEIASTTESDSTTSKSISFH